MAHFIILKPIFVNTMFFLKYKVKYFPFIRVLRNKFVYVVVLSIVTETFFGDILRITCHNDFKCSSINFHKQMKQSAKYQDLGIAPQYYCKKAFPISFLALSVILVDRIRCVKSVRIRSFLVGIFLHSD